MQQTQTYTQVQQPYNELPVYMLGGVHTHFPLINGELDQTEIYMRKKSIWNGFHTSKKNNEKAWKKKRPVRKGVGAGERAKKGNGI